MKLFTFGQYRNLIAIQDYPHREFQAESLIPTAFGVTIAPLLMDARNILYWNLLNRRIYSNIISEWGPVPGSPVPNEELYLFLIGAQKRYKPKTDIKVVKGKHGEPFFLPFVQLVASGELEKTLPREE